MAMNKIKLWAKNQTDETKCIAVDLLNEYRYPHTIHNLTGRKLITVFITN